MKTKTFEQLVQTHSENLYRFSHSIVKDEALAKDIVQEVFIKIWEQNDDRIEILQPKSFLYKMVRNKSIDYLRSENTRKVNEQSGRFEEEQDNEIFNTKLDLVKSYMKKIPEAQKEVIILRDFEGLSYQEISETIGVSLAKVKVLIHRGRNKLKQCINDDEAIRQKIYG